MKFGRAVIAIMVGLFALAACGDGADSVDQAVSSLPSQSEVSDAGANVLSEIETLTEQIQSSEAADQLQAAWVDLQSELTVAVNSVAADQPIDEDAIQQELNSFQSEVEAAGDSVSDELRSAWETLRTEFEQLIS